jgi:hypothetical protein
MARQTELQVRDADLQATVRPRQVEGEYHTMIQQEAFWSLSAAKMQDELFQEGHELFQEKATADWFHHECNVLRGDLHNVQSRLF